MTAQIDLAVASREAAVKIWLQIGDRRKEGENRCHLALLHWSDARMDDADREATAAVVILEALPPGRELAMAYACPARRGTGAHSDHRTTLLVGRYLIAVRGRPCNVQDHLEACRAWSLSSGERTGADPLR